MERRILTGAYIVITIFAVFLLRLWYLQVIKGGEYKKIAERNRLRAIEIPAPRGIIYDRNNNALVRNIPTFDISVVKEDLPSDSETLSELGRLLGLNPEEIKNRLKRASSNPFEPVVKLKQNLSLEEVARIEAHKIDFPGLQVDVVVSREYLYGRLASHIIGYLGRLTLNQAKDPDYSDVPKEAFIGQMGAEGIYDKILRGVAGKKIIEVDAVGRVTKLIGVQPHINGEDIRLTIDRTVQAEAEYALGDKTGAVVAIDPNTGEILAMASSPSFDPNLFAKGINYTDWENIINDSQKPLLNRAIQSQYPPGSTFKIVTAIAALEEGAITEETTAHCSGGIFVGRLFKCWRGKGHGTVRLHRAIVESCDVYFYETGRKVGIDKIAEYASALGLGKPTGIELDGEKSGIVPSTSWKLRILKQQWFTGETLNTAIGQGYVSATPHQMARLIAAVSNGGKLYKPHILKDSEHDYLDKVVEIKPDTLNLVKSALVGVVSENGGTGHAARSNIVSIGGKTGTAQVVGGDRASRNFKDHAWFVAFAPVENPQIAVAVFVEHGGHGGATAAPIAKRVIEAYFKEKIEDEKGSRLGESPEETSGQGFKGRKLKNQISKIKIVEEDF